MMYSHPMLDNTDERKHHDHLCCWSSECFRNSANLRGMDSTRPL